VRGKDEVNVYMRQGETPGAVSHEVDFILRLSSFP